jgi:hypothetical protein
MLPLLCIRYAALKEAFRLIISQKPDWACNPKETVNLSIYQRFASRVTNIVAPYLVHK